MTTIYNITYNAQYDSHEVTFESKPSTAVLDALKALKMRWNPKKACWYGFANEHDIIDAIISNGEGETITGEKTEGATVYTDGYLGGGAVYGSKSNKHLYGAELSKAIREDIKRAGIKGVSVRCKSYSGGQSISVTVSLKPEEYKPFPEFLAGVNINDLCAFCRLRYGNNQNDEISRDEYFTLSGEDQKRIMYKAAVYDYNRLTTTEITLNQYHIDRCKQFTIETMAKINTIHSIICAYHYDESNAMVDYFDTNFYYDIVTKPVDPRPVDPTEDDENAFVNADHRNELEKAVDEMETAEQAEEPAEDHTADEISAGHPAEAPEVVYTIDDIGHDIAVKRIGDDLYSVEFREDGKRLGAPENHSAETIDFCYGVDVNATPKMNEAKPEEPLSESDAKKISEEVTEPSEAMPEPVKPSPIREDLARRAHDMMSCSDYREGSATAEYNALCERAGAIAEAQKRKVDPMYHSKIDALLASYVRRMADNINRRNEIGTRCPSVLVAGPANFPVRKKQKQNAVSDRNMEEYNEIQKILDRIRSTGTGGITTDDPNAREKIEKKIGALEQLQKRMKAINAYYRKHKTLDGCHDITPEQAETLVSSMRNDWRTNPEPFESYQLANNNAEIHRLKERLAEMDRLSANTENGWAFDGGTVEICREDNRVRIFHDVKPDADVIAELKNNGFRWAPSVGAWQRQYTENAINAARRITT